MTLTMKTRNEGRKKQLKIVGSLKEALLRLAVFLMFFFKFFLLIIHEKRRGKPYINIKKDGIRSDRLFRWFTVLTVLSIDK